MIPLLLSAGEPVDQEDWEGDEEDRGEGDRAHLVLVQLPMLPVARGGDGKSPAVDGGERQRKRCCSRERGDGCLRDGCPRTVYAPSDFCPL